MNNFIKSLLISLVVLSAQALALHLTWKDGERHGRIRQYAEDLISLRTTDTVTVMRIDTLHIPKPVPVFIELTDTLYLALEESGIVQPDEDSIAVPIERRVYEDSLYRAVVSGYMPSLDEIDIFAKTTTIRETTTIRIEPSRWSIGLTAGIGITREGGRPYVGVGVQYTLWRPHGKGAPT